MLDKFCGYAIIELWTVMESFLTTTNTPYSA